MPKPKPAPSARPTAKQKVRRWTDAFDRSFPSWPSPESLHPGPQTVLGAVCGSPEQRAIVDAYAFRFPCTIVEVLD